MTLGEVINIYESTFAREKPNMIIQICREDCFDEFDTISLKSRILESLKHKEVTAIGAADIDCIRVIIHD